MITQYFKNGRKISNILKGEEGFGFPYLMLETMRRAQEKQKERAQSRYTTQERITPNEIISLLTNPRGDSIITTYPHYIGFTPPANETVRRMNGTVATPAWNNARSKWQRANLAYKASQLPNNAFPSSHYSHP